MSWLLTFCAKWSCFYTKFRRCTLHLERRKKPSDKKLLGLVREPSIFSSSHFTYRNAISVEMDATMFHNHTKRVCSFISSVRSAVDEKRHRKLCSIRPCGVRRECRGRKTLSWLRSLPLYDQIFITTKKSFKQNSITTWHDNVSSVDENFLINELRDED